MPYNKPMEKVLRYQITEMEKDCTVGQILKKQLGLSKKEISRAKFREDGILLDGVRRRVADPVRPGALLEIRLESEDQSSRKLVPEEGVLTVCYEDEDVIVVDKPGGILVHPAGAHFSDTLANRLEDYFQKKGEPAVIRPIGRLDKDTAGLVLFAKNRAAAARLSAQRERGELKKTYLALVQGVPEPLEGWIRAPIGKASDSPLRMEIREDGRPARTYYRVLEILDGASLVQAQIQTGRTHQIRVHMAWIGHPLLGDPLYQPDFKQKKAPGEEPSDMALWAWRLTFLQPFSGRRVSLESAEISGVRNQIQTFRKH
ncbi:MAG: RluA family pseudouridine synthase [Candidatus Limivivens sp.]|nr:RluA family pseudouridine synthase [Candidatus Limivivens sp.]